MRINIAVVGRFHAFNLASYLYKNKLLGLLITTYPRYIAKKWGINKKNIISEPLLEFLNRYRKYIPFISSTKINTFIKIIHSKRVAKKSSDCDFLISWSGSSLEAFTSSSKRNTIKILERGSSHYSYQVKVLSEEYLSCNLKFTPNCEQWQRELLEYELADYISIPSTFVKRTFLEYGVPEHKMIVNPYGVDLKEFNQIPKTDDVFRIIFAGGGTVRKGYHHLLQAFSELNLPNCELWHLGNVADEMNPYLEKYKNENWILKGHKPQNELYKYYSQGSVFVLPSLEDGFGMVIFQAMSCGLPVILSENTGGYDAVTNDGEEGFVIPIRDINILKEKISFLYNNKNLAKIMGKKAKLKVISGYSWDDYGRRYVENLKKIELNNHEE